MVISRYAKSNGVKRFTDMWMALERSVLHTKNINSARYAEVTKCIKDMLAEEDIHERDFEESIYFLFSDHPYAQKFAKPYATGFGKGRPYDIWFLKRNYHQIQFNLAEIVDTVPPQYIRWSSEEFRKDLGIIFATFPASTFDANMDVSEYQDTALLYKIIKYRDTDDWDFFLHSGGNERHFRLLFGKLYKDRNAIPRAFVTWYFEHFRKKKKVLIKKPVRS